MKLSDFAENFDITIDFAGDGVDYFDYAVQFNDEKTEHLSSSDLLSIADGLTQLANKINNMFKD